MPCMCGDFCCPSCGPAQGNYRCPICRSWASEGCDHMDENGIRPEFKAQADAIWKAEVDAEEAYFRQVAAEAEEPPYGTRNTSLP